MKFALELCKKYGVKEPRMLFNPDVYWRLTENERKMLHAYRGR